MARIRAQPPTIASTMNQTTTDTPDASATDVQTVSFVSLGCPKNLVDSEKMLGLLAEDGLTPVSSDPEAGEAPADAVVINTCGFLEASKQESMQVIDEAVKRKEAGELKRVVVAGCLVQRHRAKMLEWNPGIDAMIGVFDRDHIVRAVRGAAPERTNLAQASDQPKYWIAGNALQAAGERGMDTVGLTVHGKDGKGLGYFEDDGARLRLTPRHYTYLKMSEGCNQKCAFCTIPSIRGKMRSKPMDRILDEARELFEDGAFEINLIGQDTTSYGDDIGTGFDQSLGTGGLVKLLTELNRAVDTHAGGHAWLRLMYAYPTNFAPEMIDAIAELPHVCKYIDIPLQHASDSVLTAMRRNVCASQQKELLLELRERVPGIAIRTTFISGFPGETEQDHEQLLDLIDEVGFEAMGVFAYSPEPGTPAGRMELDDKLRVPDEVKERRKDELMELQQRVAFEQAAFLAEQWDPQKPADSGLHFDVLIDKKLSSSTKGVAGVGSKSNDRDAAASGAGRLHEGRCYFQAVDIDSVTYVQSREQLAPGELVRCAIVGSDGYDLIARPVDELANRVSLPIL